jgi:hypothetical protein
MDVPRCRESLELADGELDSIHDSIGSQYGFRIVQLEELSRVRARGPGDVSMLNAVVVPEHLRGVLDAKSQWGGFSHPRGHPRDQLLNAHHASLPELLKCWRIGQTAVDPRVRRDRRGRIDVAIYRNISTSSTHALIDAETNTSRTPAHTQ